MFLVECGIFYQNHLIGHVVPSFSLEKLIYLIVLVQLLCLVLLLVVSIGLIILLIQVNFMVLLDQKRLKCKLLLSELDINGLEQNVALQVPSCLINQNYFNAIYYYWQYFVESLLFTL